MRHFLKFNFILNGILFCSFQSQAQSQPSGIYEEILVTGGKGAIETLPGSATFLDKETIKQFDSTDLNALLAQVPGVYIRQEDGFGLRPNIGLRGTSSDRSSKLTMMEDGILIGPAPYSAPAAYYVPNVNRMSAVEVFKGPSAIAYGPHTVGGAINFVTKAIPDESGGELGVSTGSHGYQKYTGYYGRRFDQIGFDLDLLHYGADGFKELDGGGNTGFERNDANLKLQWQSDPKASVSQALQIKAGYADEDSNETYLGLTDEDFAENPNRRYASSQLDRFVSEHSQVHVLYSLDFKNDWKLTARAYQNNYQRSWNKFDGFPGANTENASDVLNQNSINLADELQLLRGDRNSNLIAASADEDAERIDVTDNDRKFQSSGIQLHLNYQTAYGEWSHFLESGLRVHNDWVERDHLQRRYLMIDRTLVFDSIGEQKALNKGEVDALSWFIQDRIEIRRLTLTLGMRLESIDSTFVERKSGVAVEQSHSQNEWMPGVGAYYQLNEQWGFLLGINKGFSPKAASAGEEVKSEESTNYEYGFRFKTEHWNGEIIGFYSNYQDLLGRCRASEDCYGEEFNAGNVETVGVEASSQYSYRFSNGWEIPLSLTYTYTDAKFKSSFESDFSQWGHISKGDELPYVPKHQGALQTGLRSEVWSFAIALKYVGVMKEASGSGVPLSGEETESLTTLDTSFEYYFQENVNLQLIVENITDEQLIVSRRPFGARPNAPRTLKAGITYRF